MLVAIPSPFPWAPGHTAMEIDYLIRKQLISDCVATVYLPVLPGPVTSPFFDIYSESLSRFNIQPIRDINQIYQLLNDANWEDFLNIAISHSPHVVNTDLIKRNTRIHHLDSAFSKLSNGKLRQHVASTKLVTTITNEFSHYCY